jgi:hypothetical protein
MSGEEEKEWGRGKRVGKRKKSGEEGKEWGRGKRVGKREKSGEEGKEWGEGNGKKQNSWAGLQCCENAMGVAGSARNAT